MGQPRSATADSPPVSRRSALGARSRDRGLTRHHLVVVEPAAAFAREAVTAHVTVTAHEAVGVAVPVVAMMARTALEALTEPVLARHPLARELLARELLARLRAVLRRGTATPTERLTVGELSVDVPGHDVRLRGEVVPLTGLEFDILLALARRAGRVVPRAALMDEAGRGDTVVGDRAVDVHVSHLRQKLGDDPRTPRLIRTVRGVGYLLVKP